MKLRNKKTGEIKEVIVGGYPVTGKTKMWECSEMDINEETGYKSLGTYTSLAELNAEWEDVPEEPKEYWFIDYDGGIIPFSKMKDTATDKLMKQIGNYFETEEEAEKAVEKLKAWKRLKDNGFEFRRWEIIDGTINFMILPKGDYREKVYEDLRICFGGEE